MPFIKAEVCLDIGTAVENMNIVFADTKLQMEQSSRKMMGGRQQKGLRWHLPGLGTQSWRSRTRLGMEERETREVEPNRQEEHRERRVKGEQCRDLGGQPNPRQVPGTMNAHRPAENRLGVKAQQGSCAVLWTKGNTRICCFIKWVSADSVA